MISDVHTIIYPVGDLDAAKKLFTTLLGAEPAADYPQYAGYETHGRHVGLDPNGHASGMNGPTVFWHTDDIEGDRKKLLDAGTSAAAAIKDVGGGRLVATVKDADGNLLGLLQPGQW